MKELISIQNELVAPKNRYNSFGGYYYRNAEDILNAVKDLLKIYQCVLTLSDDIVLVGNRIYVKATASIKNKAGETVEVTAFARESEARKGMDDSQITGGASSYARKYALNGLFLIDDNKDADDDTHNNKISNSDLNITSSLANCKTKDDLTILWDSLEDDEQKKYRAVFTKRKLNLK